MFNSLRQYRLRALSQSHSFASFRLSYVIAHSHRFDLLFLPKEKNFYLILSTY